MTAENVRRYLVAESDVGPVSALVVCLICFYNDDSVFKERKLHEVVHVVADFIVRDSRVYLSSQYVGIPSILLTYSIGIVTKKAAQFQRIEQLVCFVSCDG